MVHFFAIVVLQGALNTEPVQRPFVVESPEDIPLERCQIGKSNIGAVLLAQQPTVGL